MFRISENISVDVRIEVVGMNITSSYIQISKFVMVITGTMTAT